MACTPDNNTHTLLDEILQINDFIRVTLPQNGNNLFHALSFGLYQTTKKHDVLKNICIGKVQLTYLYSFGAKKVNKRVTDFTEYVKNPLLPTYERATLEMLAELLDIKIKIYYLNHTSLCVDIYNSKGLKNIKLVKVHDFHYEPLLAQKGFRTTAFVQNLVLNIVNSAINNKNSGPNNLSDNVLINYEFKSWNYDRFIKSKFVLEFMKPKVDRNSTFCNEIAINDNLDDLQLLVEDFQDKYNRISTEDFLVNNEYDQDTLSFDIDKVGNNQITASDSSNLIVIKDIRDVNANQNIEFKEEDFQLIESNYHPYLNFFEPNNISNSKQNGNIRHFHDENFSYNQYEFGYSNRNEFENVYQITNPRNISPDFNQSSNLLQESRFGEPSESSDLNDLKIDPYQKYTGTLKFFDEKNNFGFITLVSNPSVDVFVFGSEFLKSNIPLNILKNIDKKPVVFFQFNIVVYYGRYGKSKKAINISLSNS